MNFVRRIFSECHSFRSMFQSEWKVSKGACKLKIKEVLGADRISTWCCKFCDRLRRGYKLRLMSAIWRKKDPSAVRVLNGKYWASLADNKAPVEWLNKPCQGNVNNGRKSFVAEGFSWIWNYLSVAKHIRKLWRFPSDKVILELVNPSKYHPRVVFSLSFHLFWWLALMRRCARRMSDAVEVQGFTLSRQRIYSVYFATHLYNL